MSIGNNIKALRKLKNIKQKDMADALGYSCQNVSKWENDISTPDIDTVLAIAKFFGVSTDTLLGHALDEISESINVTVNDSSDFAVWTDFEYMGSIAPEAYKTEGRRRAKASLPTRASDMKNCIMIGADTEGKICFIREVVSGRFHHNGAHWCYQRSDKCDCIFCTDKTYKWWYEKGKFELVLPKGGFMLVADLHSAKTQRLLEFIVPKKYHECIDRANFAYTNFVSANTSYNRYLFVDIISRGELDNIDVSLDGESVCFKKPNDFINPLYDNIDALTETVKERVEKSLNDINNAYTVLSSRLDDIESIAEDAQCTAEEAQSMAEENEDLEQKLDELESKIEELESKIEELEEKISDLEDGE